MHDQSTQPQKNHPLQPFPVVFSAFIVALLLGVGPLSSYAQTFTLTPSSPDSEGDFGIAVDRVGELTESGTPLVAVGAQEEDINFDGDGRVYIYEGNSGAEVASFGSPNSTINGNFGGSVSYVGDLGGGSTAPDVLIGASNEDTDGINRAGAAYAFTHTGTRIRTFKSPNIEDDGSFGGSVNSIADLTGDGVREVLIGAPRETVSSGGTDYARAGRLYVMNGATGATLHTLESDNPEQDGNFGVSSDAVGDVDGDGEPDVVVGAKGEAVNGSDSAGRAYVFSGATGTLLYTLTSDDVQRSGSFGGSNSVAGVGDINGDGTPDLAVAAGGEDGVESGETTSGNVYLFSGDGSLLYALPSPSPTFLGNFGTAVDGLGDVDDDGHDDFVVGAKSEGTNGNNAGLAYLLSGVDGSVISTLQSQNPEDAGKFGETVAYAGDVDDDTIPDVITGALEEDVGGTGDAGQAYVHTGFYFFLAEKSQRTVSSDGLVDFGATGVDVDFSNVTQSGEVSAFRLTDSPRNPGVISESTISDYRVALFSGGTQFGSNTEVRFAVSTFSGINDPTEVTVYTRPEVGSGTFSAMSKNINENGTPNDPSDDEIVVTTDSFSEFVFASNSQPLPVELTQFDAQVTEDAVTLHWATASETNNAGFEVQRRVDDTWKALSFVDGAGTTDTPQTYRFRDHAPTFADSLVYRLRQVDTEGTATLSSQVVVHRQPGSAVRLAAPAPNPVRQQATVQYVVPDGATQPVRLDVYNALGQRVATLVNESQAPGHQELSLDASRWASGTYFLRLQVGNATRSQRVTVVR